MKTSKFQQKLDEMEKKINDSKQSGFFDLPPDTRCKHPEHEPPTHLCIPQGKGYRHECPQCGKITIVIPQQIYF